MVNFVYDNSPVFIQNLFVSLQGYRQNKSRYGKHYESYLNKFRNSQNDDKFEVQLRELNKLLIFSKMNSEFYQEKLKNVELPLRDLKDLKKITEITKEDVRTHIDSIITLRKDQAIITHTGGTTGKSLTVYRTQEDMEKRIAYLDFFKEKHGVIKGMKRASFMGRAIIPVKNKKKIYWRYNKSLNQMLYSSFHLSDESLRYYVNSLNSFKPLSLDGFPSSLVSIARYILKNKIKLEFQPICIFPTAETLYENDKKIIEQAFNSPVRDQYASSEGAPFITECIKGNLHMNIETGVFEAEVEGEKETGILVTSFQNYGTPLIRYKIGDSVIFSERRCNCGDNSPLVDKIVGRTADYLITSKGNKITSVNMANAIKVLPNSILESQFIQIDNLTIEINLVVDPVNYNSTHETILLNEMIQRFGNETTFIVRVVENLTKDKSGKTRMIINKFKQ